MKLQSDFYQREDVVLIAKELIGKELYTVVDGEGLSAGIITETEAYAGTTDKASHAYGGRNTDRTSTMYREGGTTYIYLCYGIHSLFNVVTNVHGIPHAVLIRAIYPTKGIDLILQRRKAKSLSKNLTVGPGKVALALGIHYSNTNGSLYGNDTWIEDAGLQIPGDMLHAGPRIGVDYAAEDALLPYRFWVDHADLSKLI